MKYNHEQFKIYLAGFFDGEGHIGLLVTNQKPLHMTLRIHITQNDSKVLEYGRKIYGGYLFKKSYQNGSETHVWELTALKAAKVIDDIYPYVIVKKRQLTVAKAFKMIQNDNKGKTRKESTLKEMLDMKLQISILNRQFSTLSRERG